MKVLLDTHMLGKEKTGNERYWRNLSRALEKYTKDIIILNYNSKLNNGLYRIFLGFDSAIKKFKPDLIHVQNFTPLKKTVPIINTVHDVCFKISPHTFSLKSLIAFNFFLPRSLKMSDAIICPSEYTKNLLLRYYDINYKKIYVVYEAPDPVFYFIENKNKVKQYLKRKFKILNQYFLVVGNVEKRKLPQLTINTFRQVNKIYPNLKLIFVGPEKIKIKKERNIYFFGYLKNEELNFLYNGALALIYLSLCEGFGLPLVEAMATKTPIICNDILVFKEIAQNSALFIKNKKELYQIMKEIYKNKNLREKYKNIVFHRSKFFNWEKTAKETIKIYERVLKKNI